MSEEVSRIIAYLDRLGATYHVIDGHPDWYEARWPDKEAPGGYARWACQDHPDDPRRERPVAQAFKNRAIGRASAHKP